MRVRQRMEGLQRVLYAKCDFLGAGRTTAGGENARPIHRLDERNVNRTSGRPLRSEIIRDGQCAEQCRRIRSFLWDAYWSGWAGASHRPRDQLGLCLRNAVRRRQDRPYDQNMKRWSGSQGPRLGIERLPTTPNKTNDPFTCKGSFAASRESAVPPPTREACRIVALRASLWM